MSLLSRQQSERFLRVSVFGQQHEATFPATSKAGQLFARIGVLAGELNAASATQQGDSGGAVAATGLKSGVFALIERLVDSISGTASILDNPARAAQFAPPANRAEGTYVTAARSYLAQAQAPAVQAEFIAYQVRPDFYAVLTDAVADYDAANAQRVGSVQIRNASTTDVAADIAEGVAIIEKLDIIVKNAYGPDSEENRLYKRAKKLEELLARHRAVVAAPVAT